MLEIQVCNTKRLKTAWIRNENAVFLCLWRKTPLLIGWGLTLLDRLLGSLEKFLHGGEGAHSYVSSYTSELYWMHMIWASVFQKNPGGTGNVPFKNSVCICISYNEHSQACITSVASHSCFLPQTKKGVQVVQFLQADN